MSNFYRRDLTNLLIITIVIVTFFCAINEQFASEAKFTFGGQQSWLSGSTIKFVNQWLKEGAWNLKFTSYENPASIEFPTLESRDPYLSYPPGTVFLVTLLAKLANKKIINIYFVKQIDIFLYCLDAIFLSFICYVFFRNFHIKSRWIHIGVPIITSIFWILLPANTYYLNNVLYADQVVLFPVFLFTLLELLSLFYSKNKKIFLEFLKALIVFSGALIEYYFWIVVFIAFVSRMIQLIVLREDKKKITFYSLTYIIPICSSVLVYYRQLSYSENWSSKLISKFFERTIGGVQADYKNRFFVILKNIQLSLSSSEISFFILIAIILIALTIGFRFALRNRLISKLFSSTNFIICLTIFIPPIIQLLVFNQHSAIHEFSILKIGFPFVFLIPTISYLIYKVFFRSSSNLQTQNHNQGINKKKRLENPEFQIIFIAILLIFSFLTDLLNNRTVYYYQRIGDRDYKLENVIREKMKYEDVCFSFTYKIDANPPMHLAVAGKRVYKIENLNEIGEIFPNLNKAANKILIIDKTVMKDNETMEKEKEAISTGTVLFDDNLYLFLKLL